MPALYALAQHRALQEAARVLSPEDTLLAFLDDLMDHRFGGDDRGARA